MTEIPIVVSDDVVTVGGYTDKVELQLSVGATGERGSRIFTGSVNPNTLPSNDPIWGGYTDFKRGDIYLLRDTDLLEVWEYLWSGGEYVWVQTVDNIAGGGGSVTLDPDLDAIAALTGTGILKRTAPNTWALDTTSYLTGNQTITLSGDASGSGTTSIVVTVADDSHSHTGSTISGLDAGDTTTGTFDIARIPTGTTGTTVALGNHTHSYQPVDGDLTAIAAVSGTGYLRRTGVDTWTLDTPATATWGGITGTLSSQTDLQSALDGKQSADADLTAIAALAGTSGFLKKTATDTWALDTNTYLTGNQSISVSGDATGSGTTSIALTLANSGVAAGTYNNNAAQVRPFTVDAKGRVTSIGAAVNIAIPQSAVTNLTTDLSGKSPLAGSSSIQTVGTIYTGNWNAGPVTSRYFYQWANGEPTSNLGSPTVSEMALFDSQFNNKLWFYDPTKFTFTYTMNGTDWITQSNSTSEIKNLVGGAGATGSNISIPNLAQKYRIDIRNDGTYVYTNALYMYFSTNSHQTKVHIWKKRDDGSWTQVTSSNTNVSSWPGHLYLPFDTIPWSTSLTGGHYNDIRIEFTPTWTTGGSYDYTNISLINLEIWGGYPAGRRTIYNWDSDKNVTFPAALTATTTISGSGLAGSLLSSTNPLMDGAAAAGTSAIPSRQDHVHPVDTSRSPVAGSSSITTVGTIGSGTWQGSVVAGQYGGTGVANTGKTITVSGNTTIGSSTHTVAFATSGNTSVTLPTSGTLEVTGHTHAYQPIDADLTAIAALAGTSGLLKKTAADTWALDTNTYLTGNQTITLSGDASGSGTTAITVTVADDSHSHTGATISGLDAADTTTGTFDIARIPTGSTGTTVSLGNHTHAYLSSSTSSTQDGYFGDIYLYDDSTPSHYLRITNSANLTLARALNINVNDADRTVSLSGNLTVPSAATVSGTNTGDQTITLTGNVTGSGTGSFAATIANDAVTYAKMQNVSAQYRVLGRITAAAGDVEELTGENLVTVLGQATSKTGSGSIVFHTAPTFSGTVTATTFSGSGASLTSIPQSAVTNLTTDLSGKQPLDADLTAIAGLAGTSGLLKKTAADTWTLDTSTYLTSNQTITLSGDATGSGTTSITVAVVDDSHSHTGATISGLDAGDTTTGTFDIARIPTGTTGSTVALGNHTHSYLPLSGGTLTGVVWQSAGGIGQYGSGRGIEQRDTLGSGYGWALSSTSTDWFILGVYDTFGEQPGTLIFNSTSNRWQFTGNIRSADNIMINGSSKLLIGTETGGFKGEIRSQSNYPIVFMPYDQTGTALSSAEFFYKTDSSRWQTESNFRVDGTLWIGGASTLDGNTVINGLADFNGGVSLVGSSTDNAIVRFDSTAGNVQNSGVTVSDINDVTVPGNVYVNGTASTDPILRVDAATGRTPYLTLRSQGPQDVYMILSRENVTRFAIRSTQDEFSIRSASDAGDIWASAPYGNVFQIHRPTGKITLGPHTTGGYTAGLEFGTSGPRIMTGTTSPEGSVTAPVGSEVINTSDGSKYDKISGTGNTGWSLRVNGAGYVEDTQVMMMMGVL